MSSSDAVSLADRVLLADEAARVRVAASTPIRFAQDGEPYLALDAPLEQFRITPARRSDAEDISRVLSTLSIARNIVGPAFPLPASRLTGWLGMLHSVASSALADLAAGKYQGVSGSPFQVLREITDGRERYVGELSIGLIEGAERWTPVDKAWEEWRDRGVWTIGACFSEEYHGLGLAKAALRAQLAFAQAHVGATEIRAECLARNIASVRLWEGAGFVKDQERSGKIIQIDEAKGGGKEVEAVYSWRFVG